MTIDEDSYIAASEDAIFRASIQMIPTIGGPLDTLIFTHASKIKESRFLKVIEDLKKDLKNLNQDKIDINFLNSEDFLYFSENIFRRFIEENNIEKVKLYKKLFKNFILKNEYPDQLRDILQTIDLLTPNQIVLLKIIKEFNDQKFLPIIHPKFRSKVKAMYGDQSIYVDSELDKLVGLGILQNLLENNINGEIGEDPDASIDLDENYKLSKYGVLIISYLSKS